MLALDMFASRAAAWIAAVSTSLQRLDALVFTGGIGEHSHPMRQAICRGLAGRGVLMPAEADNDADSVLATGSTVAVLRFAAREDIVVAREVERAQRLN